MQVAATAQAIRDYMREYEEKGHQHHSDDHVYHHDFQHFDGAHTPEAIQRHLTESHLLTEPHATIHDALRHQDGVTVREIEPPTRAPDAHETPLRRWRQTHDEQQNVKDQMKEA